MPHQHKIIILNAAFFIWGCAKELPPEPQLQINSFYQPVITPDDRKTITPEEAKTYHVDKEFLYEYRTGYSGRYEYNYDVKGIDLKGDSVFGNINIEGKQGAGMLKIDKKEIDINAEWIDYGKLKATDKKGNQYDLVVK